MIPQTMNTIDKPVVWGGDDAFTHTLAIGPTRCGKTATILKPLIYQILKAKAAGKKVGLSVVEPKGDVAAMVKEMCDFMNVPCIYIDPTNPNSDKINVMQGDKNDIAEATVAVLKSLFGKQEAFFATVQELSARKITLLLKELYGDQMDITDVLTNLREQHILMANVQKLKQRQGDTELVKFFENELLGSMREKYQQLIIGLRAQMENITSNEYLKNIITGQSSFNLDEHFEKGGVLAVNTALGLLGRAGDAFGQFVAMHLQLATFRRKGTERTRVPHYMIFDEYSRYINPDVERFLSIAAEYRVAGIFAIQSLGQLEVESGQISGKAMKQAIMTSTRNKIVFGGLSAEDAQELSKEFGKYTILQREKTYNGLLIKNPFPKSFKDKEVEKDRFPYTLLMDGLPRFHFVHKLLQEGHPQPPKMAVGDFVPGDWKEQFLNKNREAPVRERQSFRVKLKKKALDMIEFKKQEEIKHREALQKERFTKLENPFIEESEQQDELTLPKIQFITSKPNKKTQNIEDKQIITKNDQAAISDSSTPHLIKEVIQTQIVQSEKRDEQSLQNNQNNKLEENQNMNLQAIHSNREDDFW